MADSSISTGPPSAKLDEKAQVQSTYEITESHKTWTDEEEIALVRKIDLILIPILWVGFFALQLDRGNIGNALTDNFLEDVNIRQNQFNIGGSLMSLGIVLFEIPSNIILMRLGPKVWIGGQIIAWGLVAIFQSFQYGLGAFLSTRFLLGMCEAGFIPASLYTLSLWYKSSEMSKRFAIFFTGNILAQAVGSLLAFAILHMRGIAGRTGWQWLFMLEGLFTVVVGIIFIFMFPGSPENPISICRLEWFNGREVMILQERILLDDFSKRGEKHKITARDVLDTLSDWRLWPHLLMPICSNTPASAFASYGPSIITSFGYGHLESNALASIGQWISGGLLFLAGFVADKTGRRGIVSFSCIAIQFVILLAYKFLPTTESRGTRLAVFTLAASTQLWSHPMNGAWLSVNAKSPGERSMRMALLIMCANCAGIIGSQIFREGDAPNYPKGFSVAVSLVAVALASAATGIVGYAFANRKVKKELGSAVAQLGSSDEEQQSDSDIGATTGTAIRLYNY